MTVLRRSNNVALKLFSHNLWVAYRYTVASYTAAQTPSNSICYALCLSASSSVPDFHPAFKARRVFPNLFTSFAKSHPAEQFSSPPNGLMHSFGAKPQTSVCHSGSILRHHSLARQIRLATPHAQAPKTFSSHDCLNSLEQQVF
jgi:hypothetical protein